MSSTEHDTNRRNEVLGIALFLMGSLPLVLVVLTLVREPGSEAAGVAALPISVMRCGPSIGLPCRPRRRHRDSS